MRTELLAYYAEFQRLLADYFARIPGNAWQNRTESRPQGWTLHETLAHLVTAGEGFQTMVQQRLADEPVHIPGLEKRTDLSAWNTQQIAIAAQTAPSDLIKRLLQVFTTAQTQIAELPDSAFDLMIPMPMYNRPGTVAEVFGWQCCHPGIVHAAQVANGAHLEPLWWHYNPALFRWMLTQFLNQMAHSYWPERGGNLDVSVNIIIGGDHGGRWHVTMQPAGGTASVGIVSKANLTLRFRNAPTFCHVFTRQITPLRAIFTGRAFATGNLPLAFRLGYLLNPT